MRWWCTACSTYPSRHSLHKNKISDTGLEAIAASLPSCPHLEELLYAGSATMSLGQCGISPSCMRLYCTVWSSRLGSNDFGDIGTQVLAAALRSCTLLSRLSYASCAPGVSIRRIVTTVGPCMNPCYVVRLACPGTGLATPVCRRS